MARNHIGAQTKDSKKCKPTGGASDSRKKTEHQDDDEDNLLRKKWEGKPHSQPKTILQLVSLLKKKGSPHSLGVSRVTTRKMLLRNVFGREMRNSPQNIELRSHSCVSQKKRGVGKGRVPDRTPRGMIGLRRECKNIKETPSKNGFIVFLIKKQSVNSGDK